MVNYFLEIDLVASSRCSEQNLDFHGSFSLQSGLESVWSVHLPTPQKIPGSFYFSFLLLNATFLLPDVRGFAGLASHHI